MLTGMNQKNLITGFSSFKQTLKLICSFIALASLFFAILRPQWNKQEELCIQEGRDLYICLDISRSMLATDCIPSRLEMAKEKIKKLLSLLSCDRVSLIIFSGSAFILCPLTSDHNAFMLFLETVDVETISSGSTSIENALKLVISTINQGQNKKNNLALLFTDGEDFSLNLALSKQEAKNLNLSIFAIGIATKEGAPIPLYDSHGKQIGHQKDHSGKIVISRLNEEILSSLVSDLGGKYIQTTEDSKDIQEISNLVSTYEKERFEEKKVSRMQDQYPVFIIISLLFFALEWLL